MVTQNNAVDISPVQAEPKWIIDLEWYEKNNRSFIDFASRSLCGKCADKLHKKKKKLTAEDVLAAIKDCCSKTPEYISVKLPMLESIFRVLLANGNQPMDTAKIYKELSLRRGLEAYIPPPEALAKLLAHDRWYGFKKIAEGESPDSK